MIFVTVGTTKFPFDRLLKAVDEVMVSLDSGEELVVQTGSSSYGFKYSQVKVFREISFKKMLGLFKKSRVIITHGGPATIFLALKYSKEKPLVVPRSSRLKEHINEHQCLFASFINKTGKVKVVFPDDNLIERVLNYLVCPSDNQYYSDLRPDSRLIRKLVDFTQKL